MPPQNGPHSRSSTSTKETPSPIETRYYNKEGSFDPMHLDIDCLPEETVDQFRRISKTLRPPDAFQTMKGIMENSDEESPRRIAAAHLLAIEARDEIVEVDFATGTKPSKERLEMKVLQVEADSLGPRLRGRVQSIPTHAIHIQQGDEIEFRFQEVVRLGDMEMEYDGPFGKGHPTVHVSYGEEDADIDENLAPLILECWKAGFGTNMSCQETEPDEAWIEFADTESARMFVGIVVGWFDEDGEFAAHCMGHLSDGWYYFASPIWPADGSNSIPDFCISVYFPHGDIPVALRRIREHNQAICQTADELNQG